MKTLKIVLQSNIFFIFLLVICFIYVLYFAVIKKYDSSLPNGEITLKGKVYNYKINDEKLVVYLDIGKENIKGTYYFTKSADTKINFGDTLDISGTLNNPSNNTIPNTFNYKKYLYNNKIYKVMTIKSLNVNKESNNIFTKIKKFIYKRSYQNKYLLLFICGDKTLLESETYNEFKDVGIAHLLAISGMHVSIFISILNKLLFFIKENKRKVLIITFLFFYSYIVNFSPSILRVIIFYTITFIFKKLNIKLSSVKRLFLTGFIILFLNPFNIFMTSFHYSFITSLSIILVQNKLSKNYFLNIFLISFWTLLFTLPITASLNYEINLITMLSNLLFIPYVSLFLYPFSLICFIFPFLLRVFGFFSGLMENIIGTLSQVTFLKYTIPKMSIIIIILIYIFLFLFVLFKKRYLLLFFLTLFYNQIKPKLDNDYYVIYFDVSQGDSSVIISPHHKSIVMIDTGGIRNKNVSDNVILYLKSKGITSLSYLGLTHGDFDHMGEAINLEENFKVEKVIFNCGPYNDLEKELIEVLDKKKIPYYSCIKELNIDDNKLYFLNNKDYSNENDNSSVIYTKINNHKFLFMGDAGVEVEEDLIEKYNLQNIDVLKVGHHGSKTSSSKSFIDEINPKYSIISVGKNNRYGHPNDSVLDNLNDSNIYRTDINGSIMFKIKNNKLQIETCSP